jgi:eukaryotic-like serine/threonine-protein kinase
VERTTVARHRGTALAQLSVLLRGDLDWIVMKCLEKDRTRRYDTANGLIADIQRHLRNEPVIARPPSTAYLAQKLIRRHRVGFAAAVAIAVVLAIGGVQYIRATRAERGQQELRQVAERAQASEAAVRESAEQQQQRNAKIRWAREIALPEIQHRLSRDDVLTAFTLAREAETYLGHDPALAKLWPRIAGTLTIETNPPGADVYIKPYDKPQTEWQYLGKSPIRDVQLGRAFYRWKITKEGYDPLERAHGWIIQRASLAERADIVCNLDRIGSHPRGMVRVPAGALGAWTLGDYLIDRYEVTNREYKEFVDRGGYDSEKFWRHEFVKHGDVLPWKQAMAMFRDRTGKPGPATWRNGSYGAAEADHPVTGVSWFEAAAYAESVGKRLPSIHHWLRAAGASTTRSISGFVVPLSNYGGRGTARAGQHMGMSTYGTYDMAGNAKEWCWNENHDGRRYILGGGWHGPEYMFSSLDAKPPFDRAETNGFRCMKLIDAVESPAALDAPFQAAPGRDYTAEKPKGDEEFKNFHRWFSYDKTALDAHTESVTNLDSRWREESISFNAAYNDERMAAVMFLPKNVSPPYQVILFFPGSRALQRRSRDVRLDGFTVIEPLIEAGRAVLYPIYKGTYERGPLAFPPSDSVAMRDWVVQLVKDVSRSIDYLETRGDVRLDKLAFCGSSWGGRLGVIVSAVEPRVRTSVLVVGGLPPGRRLPEVDEINFAPRVTIPTLMLNGRYDVIFPLENTQQTLFRWLGTPPEHKRHVLYDTGHDVPLNQANAETVAWLDRYLGPAK